jgi:hypothetical protein
MFVSSIKLLVLYWLALDMSSLHKEEVSEQVLHVHYCSILLRTIYDI